MGFRRLFDVRTEAGVSVAAAERMAPTLPSTAPATAATAGASAGGACTAIALIGGSWNKFFVQCGVLYVAVVAPIQAKNTPAVEPITRER